MKLLNSWTAQLADRKCERKSQALLMAFRALLTFKATLLASM